MSDRDIEAGLRRVQKANVRMMRSGQVAKRWSSSAAVFVILFIASERPRLAGNENSPTYGLDSRAEAKVYLRMPDSEAGSMPRLLSLTGAFQDVRSLTPNDSLVPYDLNAPFWSDGASKQRWISVPREPGAPGEKIAFAPTGEWKFPNGTVFVKHFDLGIDDTKATLKRRLETRLLVRDSTGGVYGVTYKWRKDNSDAELLKTNLSESISIKTVSGWRTQTWYYPSPADCRTCHTTNAGGVLGVKTRQMNRDFTYPKTGVTENQLRAWNHIGLFEPKIEQEAIAGYARLVRTEDKTASLERRARSYLDANCSQCHRPNGVVSYLDARYDTPLARQNLVDSPVVIDQGIDGARAIAPNDIWRSIVFMRVNTLEPLKMPPLAHETLDRDAVELLREWIQSLPGPPTLEPPTIGPKGGDFKSTIKVSLRHPEAGAVIRYTLDGSAPGRNATVYTGPIEISGPTTLRAKAFKPGFNRSITVQETFVVGE
jgi:uncharacterized repeat protein (TIGR03806 family)